MYFQARLESEETDSDLVKPVIDAQTQLNRLKDLMQSLFRSQYFLDESHKKEDKYEPSLIDIDADSVVLEKSLHPKPEDIDLEYTYAHINKNDDKPTESTRLEMFKNIQTPRSKVEPFNLDFFSPITSVIKNQMEEDHSEIVEDVPTVTFNCLSPTENVVDNQDPSLTKYNLSDLSRRLGGTNLYISRDNGLDITDQLEEKADPEVEIVNDTTKYAETMEELEQLMVKLSDVFQTFREPTNSIKQKEEDSLFGLVNGINDEIYGFLSKSKESCI